MPSKVELRRIRARLTFFVSVVGDCWFWTGPTDEYGNPVFDGKSVRQSLYEIDFDVIPSGYFAVPVCRKRNCVNPHHVRLVTAGQVPNWYNTIQ